jgi:hypothetical protein
VVESIKRLKTFYLSARKLSSNTRKCTNNEQYLFFIISTIIGNAGIFLLA